MNQSKSIKKFSKIGIHNLVLSLTMPSDDILTVNIHHLTPSHSLLPHYSAEWLNEIRSRRRQNTWKRMNHFWSQSNDNSWMNLLRLAMRTNWLKCTIYATLTATEIIKDCWLLFMLKRTCGWQFGTLWYMEKNLHHEGQMLKMKTCTPFFPHLNFINF